MEITVTFNNSIDEELKVPVIEHVGEHSEEFESGHNYTIETTLVTFGLKRYKNNFTVDFARWNRDMLYVDVR